MRITFHAVNDPLLHQDRFFGEITRRGFGTQHDGIRTWQCNSDGGSVVRRTVLFETKLELAGAQNQDRDTKARTVIYGGRHIGRFRPGRCR